jgi:hypothetical protein
MSGYEFTNENKSISTLKTSGKGVLKTKPTYSTRIVETNKHGKHIDKLTAEQNQAGNGPMESIYGGDIEKTAKARLPQQARKENHPTHSTISNDRDVKASDDHKSSIKFQDTHGHSGGPTQSEHKYHLDAKSATLDYDERVPLSVSATQPTLSKQTIEDDPDRFHNTMLNLASKLQYKPPVGSVYSRDFKKHPLDPKPPKMNNDPWATFRAEQPIDFATTMRNDYKDWKQGAPARNYIDLWKASQTGIPFGGRSGYKAEYLNWGQNAAAMEKPVQPKTVIAELPFIGKSTYAQNFQAPEQMVQAGKIDHNLFGKKSPLSPDVPFLAETTTGRTYQPYKVAGLQNVVKKEGYEKVEAYPGQFNTTYGNDFIKFGNKKKKEYTLKNKLTFL